MYLATRDRSAFLTDVTAWQATFLAPLHTIAKAFGGSSGSANADAVGPAPEGAKKKIRNGLPSWHRKAGRAGARAMVWDLDNDPRAEQVLAGGAMPVDTGDGRGIQSKGLLTQKDAYFRATVRG